MLRWVNKHRNSNYYEKHKLVTGRPALRLEDILPKQTQSQTVQKVHDNLRVIVKVQYLRLKRIL